MTEKPYTIERVATIAEAHRVMHEHAIRHLPVVDNGELCGIVSDRDLTVFENAGADPNTSLVHAAMAERPFIVTSDTALDEVVEIMGEHKYGSCVVMGSEGIEGIFTAADACMALAKILRTATAVA